eukprot:TRINITY_DN2306_c0_g1_i2.p1 TRINITY_DN2306_c0_g1~~TRINITY_DN2306_c0_g1_i2.p1  ORF type:complete len:121 (-),score=43.58 TRINITY_DN2306_c0_g1_i2:322-684(-)
MTKDEQDELFQHAWEQFDLDKNGSLDQKECQRVLITFGKARITVLDRKYEKLMLRESVSQLDIDAYEEQRSQARKMMERWEGGETSREFKSADVDGDGKISKEEFCHLCKDALEIREYWD